jgi:hypothetical protein
MLTRILREKHNKIYLRASRTTPPKRGLCCVTISTNPNCGVVVVVIERIVSGVICL